jgi:hypothetical protein
VIEAVKVVARVFITLWSGGETRLTEAAIDDVAKKQSSAMAVATRVCHALTASTGDLTSRAGSSGPRDDGWDSFLYVPGPGMVNRPELQRDADRCEPLPGRRTVIAAMGRLNQVIRFRMAPPQLLGLLLFRFGRSVTMDERRECRAQLASRPYTHYIPNKRAFPYIPTTPPSVLRRT